MAKHEVPFTRIDFLQQLVGDGCKLMDYFKKAVEGQLLGLENTEGYTGTSGELFTLMAGNEDCFFHVPTYFYTAWRDACGRDAVEKEGIVGFHGVELVPWGREFIVAHIKLTGTDKALNP